MPSPVSIWTSTAGGTRTGWTLSSFLVADGAPAQVIGILDEDSDLAAQLTSTPSRSPELVEGPEPPELVEGPRFVVNLLGWPHRNLADAFAGVAPAPGGVFKLGRWVDTAWGPSLADAPGWLGARLVTPIDHAGWGLLVRGVVEHVQIGPEAEEGLLAYLRGRYRSVSLAP